MAWLVLFALEQSKKAVSGFEQRKSKLEHNLRFHVDATLELSSLSRLRREQERCQWL